jgi:outer membrane protein insertion porin family
VIRRELRVVEGDVFSSGLLQLSRRNLQNLGYFEEVKVDTKRAGAEDRVDLTVDVKEKPTGAFTIGGGFSSVDGPIAVASISQSNLFGYGKRASLAGQIGSKANRFNALYSDPHFLDTDFLVEVQGFKIDTEFRDTQGFNQGTLGGSLSVGHALVEDIFGSVTYTYQRVHITDVADTAPLLVKRQAEESGGVSNTSSLTFALVRDTRDSYTEPTRGLRARAVFEYAGGILDADNNFTKVSLELSQYWPLWWKIVGHVRGSIAYGDSFGSTNCRADGLQAATRRLHQHGSPAPLRAACGCGSCDYGAWGCLWRADAEAVVGMLQKQRGGIRIGFVPIGGSGGWG